MAAARLRDRVETNEYGITCIVGYRRVKPMGRVSIRGVVYYSPSLVPFEGHSVFVHPCNCYGNYEACPVSVEGWEPIPLAALPAGA